MPLAWVRDGVAPLLLDRGGEVFGTPTLVLRRLPGRPLLAPTDVSDYVRQLASTLVAIHALPVCGLEFLPDQRVSVERSLRDEIAPPQADVLQTQVRDAARRV